MSSSQPTTPVKVPKAIINYQPSTQDAELRSNINRQLLADGSITKIHETLLHALHASPTNWPSLLQAHALTLLRSGEISTFPDLLTRVLADIRADTMGSTGNSITNSSSGAGGGATQNGKKAGVNGVNVGRGENGVSLALPKRVVEEGVRVTRECLEGVCEVVE